MPIDERPFRRSYGFDTGGSIQASRTFVCVGYDNIASVRADFETYPDINTFPDDETLVVTNQAVTPLGGNAFDLTVTYSNRRFGRQDDPRPSVNSPRYIWDSSRVVVTLPYNTRKTLTTSSISTQDTKKYWGLAEFKVEEWRTRYGVKVLLDDVANPNIFDVLRKQLNKIHTIREKDWLLVIAESKHVSELSYEATYVWERDEGTQLPIPSSVIANGETIAVFTEPTNGPVLPGFARAPYHKLEAVRPAIAGIGNANRFTISQYRAYEKDASGWRDLPGVPNL